MPSDRVPADPHPSETINPADARWAQYAACNSVGNRARLRARLRVNGAITTRFAKETSRIRYGRSNDCVELMTDSNPKDRP